MDSSDEGDHTIHQRSQGHVLFSLILTYLKSEQSVPTNIHFFIIVLPCSISPKAAWKASILVSKNHISYVIERGTAFVLNLSNYKISLSNLYQYNILFVCTHSRRIPAADSGAVSQVTSKSININRSRFDIRISSDKMFYFLSCTQLTEDKALKCIIYSIVYIELYICTFSLL